MYEIYIDCVHCLDGGECDDMLGLSKRERENEWGQERERKREKRERERGREREREREIQTHLSIYLSEL